MGGIASLFGGSSAKRDRADVLTARSALHQNVFGYALPEGQALQQEGRGLTKQAGDYFSSLLRANRADTAQMAAPAINQVQDAADAAKRREALTGTGRTGGTAELNRMQDADAAAKTADIVNDTMVRNRAMGGEGVLEAGNQNLRQALALMGLSQEAITEVLRNATESRRDSSAIRRQTFSDVASDIGNIVAGAFL